MDGLGIHGRKILEYILKKWASVQGSEFNSAHKFGFINYIPVFQLWIAVLLADLQ